jgi:hypothetical protein
MYLLWHDKSKHTFSDARFDVWTVLKIQVKVFWAVMLCNVGVGYQHFGGLHLEAGGSKVL